MALAIDASYLLRCPSDTPRFSSALHIPQHLSAPNPASFDIIVSPRILRLDRPKRRAVSVNCNTTTEKRPMSDDRMLVFVPPHPLIKHWVSVLRNGQTPCPIFKSAMAELGRLLMYEASRDWLVTACTILTNHVMEYGQREDYAALEASFEKYFTDMYQGLAEMKKHFSQLCI